MPVNIDYLHCNIGSDRIELDQLYGVSPVYLYDVNEKYRNNYGLIQRILAELNYHSSISKYLYLETIDAHKIVPMQAYCIGESVRRLKLTDKLPMFILIDGLYYNEDGHHRTVRTIYEDLQVEAWVLDLEKL